MRSSSSVSMLLLLSCRPSVVVWRLLKPRKLAPTPTREDMSCSVRLLFPTTPHPVLLTTPHNSTYIPNLAILLFAVGIIIQLVEIFIYVILAANFFRNYAARKVVRHASTSPKKSSRKSKKSKNATAAGTPPHNDTTVVNSPTASVNHDPTSSSALEKGGVHLGTGRMTRGTRLMSYGLAFSTLMLFIRAIYRTAELSDGWGGRIIHTQVYFSKF